MNHTEFLFLACICGAIDRAAADIDQRVQAVASGGALDERGDRGGDLGDERRVPGFARRVE
jgi:hypothetical protein